MFPELPVLREIVERTSDLLRLPLKCSVFVCVQHVLEANGSLFESLVKLGARPENIYLLGKPYSNHIDTARKLQARMRINYFEPTASYEPGNFDLSFKQDVTKVWLAVSNNLKKEGRQRNIIVLDDGGICLNNIPDQIMERNKVVGVEQTTSGLRLKKAYKKIPVIAVASSAAKKYVEPPLIAKAVLRKLEARGVKYTGKNCGVIGVGNIGRAVARELTKHACKVLAYDPKYTNGFRAGIPGITLSKDRDEVYSAVELIFGCTGKDISEDWPEFLKGEKTLISCSSSDVEFRSLLRKAGKSSRDTHRRPFDDIRLQFDGDQMIHILRGGYPVNFDGSKKSVPPRHIQMTMGLLLGALLQCCALVSHDSGPRGGVKLDPYIQQFVLTRWYQSLPSLHRAYGAILPSDFEQIEQLKRKSGGYDHPTDLIRDLFSSAL